MRCIFKSGPTAVERGYLWLLFSTLCLSAVAKQPTSKEWMGNNCKAYEKDYALLVNKYVSRYTSGIQVSTVLGLRIPKGRSHHLMGGARPIVYIVNNTLHYVDPTMPDRQANHLWSAGFSSTSCP